MVGVLNKFYIMLEHYVEVYLIFFYSFVCLQFFVRFFVSEEVFFYSAVGAGFCRSFFLFSSFFCLATMIKWDNSHYNGIDSVS